MATRLQLGDVTVDIIQKDIKNVHLSVYPPTGSVRISAPLDMDIGTIRVFAISKLGWVKQQQNRLRAQERELPREYIDLESHYVWGRRYLLQIVEADAAPKVELKPRRLLLHVRPGSTTATRQSVLNQWYREELRRVAPAIIDRWQRMIHVDVKGFFVQAMKTKWGSCNTAAQTIRLNTELAKKPRECLEYIVAHETVHLLEPTHSARFLALMDRHMPTWRIHRAALNRLPVRHEKWVY